MVPWEYERWNSGWLIKSKTSWKLWIVDFSWLYWVEQNYFVGVVSKWCKFTLFWKHVESGSTVLKIGLRKSMIPCVSCTLVLHIFLFIFFSVKSKLETNTTNITFSDGSIRQELGKATFSLRLSIAAVLVQIFLDADGQCLVAVYQEVFPLGVTKTPVNLYVFCQRLSLSLSMVY